VVGKRFLTVVADDYGIGPATSRGILELGSEGLISATVLLVNSPYAEEAVRDWRRAGMPMELGWHPCLTLDRPVAPPHQVQSLMQSDGQFLPLRRFVQRLYRGLVKPSEIEAEFEAQYSKFHDLVGYLPNVINSHQHVQVFPPVGTILGELLSRRHTRPYVRRIREPWRMLARVPGARIKRAFLNHLGRRDARLHDRQGFPGNDWLAGITDPRWVKDARYLTRWLSRIAGRVVELTCHPGYLDESLIDRDCTRHDGLLQRRVDELDRLRHPSFQETCQRARFYMASPFELTHLFGRRDAHAA
jgi:predicted glycoside hydrolase/deacetylase ChbG (UPF0249 family)